jgi:dihydroorotate dehydrogenase electron transfer subunit
MGANASHYKARVSRVLLEPYQNAAARLVCDGIAAPHPGQYLQIHNPGDELDAVPHSVFPSGLAKTQTSASKTELSVSGPLPESWQPGTRLLVRGPLGRGFSPPRNVRRLALAATGVPGRLLPLAAEAPQAETALFCDADASELPLSIEQRRLEDLPTAIDWADFLALQISADQVDDLGTLLKIRQSLRNNLAAQVLVCTDMPCGGLAQCGACAISTNRGQRLACEDGPVFDLNELL